MATEATGEPIEKQDEITLEDVYSEEDSSKETDAEPVKEKAVEPEPEPEPEKQEDTTPESPPSGDKKEEPWHLKAVLDERDKRQKLERELEELRKKIEPEEAPDFFSDPEKAVQSAVEKVRMEFLQREVQRNERRAVREHGEEKVQKATEWFNEVAPRYPSLLQRFHESFNDVGEVVQMYDENRRMEEMKDLPSFEAKIRADERAKLLKEMEQEQVQESGKRESITPSLAKQPSASREEEVRLDTLEDLYEGR